MTSGFTRRGALLGLAAVTPAPAGVLVQPEMPRIRGFGYRIPEPDAEIAYGPDRKQRMDVYAARRGERAPAIVFIPGGNYRYHTRRNAMMLPVYARKRGYAFAVADYRLPEAGFPAMVEDAATALAAFRARAAEFGADPNRIFLMGHSAGGHLAALVGIDPVWLAPHRLAPGQLRGLVLVEATGTVHQPKGVTAAPGGRFEQRLFAPDFTPYAVINRIPVNRRVPPVLMLYGDDNMPMSVAAKNTVAALRRGGHVAEMAHIRGEDHNTLISDIGKFGDRTASRLTAFIRTHAA